jgi:uncharacterized protein (DUF2147 family)
MIAVIKRVVGSLAVCIATCGVAVASNPIGVWIDHTGRGAVEITDCNGKLCGRLVWFKDAKHVKDGCNFQIIGNVKPVGRNKWDGGWIVDPDKNPNKKYDVEITPLSDQKLRVMGYAGMKFLSETMTWTRAPADLKKCGEEVATPNAEPSPSHGEEAPRTDTERQVEAPATKSASEPQADKPSKRNSARRESKDCKVGYAGVSIKVPCNVLQ